MGNSTDVVPLLQTVLWRLEVLFPRLENNSNDPIFEAQIQAVLVIFDDSQLDANDARTAIASLESLRKKYPTAREGRMAHYTQQAIKFLSRRLGENTVQPTSPAVDDAATLTAGRILAEDFKKN